MCSTPAFQHFHKLCLTADSYRYNVVSLVFHSSIIQISPLFPTLVHRSQHCKVLPKLFEKLLSVNVLRKCILRLLGCGIAALQVSDL